MPGSRGAWDLDQIDQWRATRQSQKDRSGTLTLDGQAQGKTAQSEVPRELFDLGEVERAKAQAILADARKKQADARIKEIQALKAENVGLVELDDVEEFISKWLAEARNIFKTLPVKLKRFGLDVARAADQEVDLALHAVRKKSEQLVELRRDR